MQSQMIMGDSAYLVGDVLEQLRTLGDETVQCVVTSPPYWGLRDYGVDGQLGAEACPEQYVAKMVEVFREVKRVLRDDGTLWLNLGDSYNSSGGHTTMEQDGRSNRSERSKMKGANVKTLKPKDLIGIPWRVAFALQQPHEKPHCIRSEIDRAWMAALVDGEGCISIRRYDSHSNGLDEARCQDGFVPFISIGNNDRELLDRCVAITGYGTVGVKDRPDVDSRGIKSRRTYYGWRLDGNKAMDVIRAIYPHLIAKRRQAVICHNLDLSNKSGKALRGNGALPSSEQDRREYMKALVNACNQRQPITMPDWIVDVKREIEPGWYLRSDIIWHKPNPMPGSQQDRPTSSHEYIFLLTKSPQYFYDAEAVKEASAPSSEARYKSAFGGRKAEALKAGDNRTAVVGNRVFSGTRQQRDVWKIPTQPLRLAHFAAFPEELVRRCVKAGASEKGRCPTCGKPWVRVLQKNRVATRPGKESKVYDPDANKQDGAGNPTYTGFNQRWRDSQEIGNRDPGRHVTDITTQGWRPACKCYDAEMKAMPMPRRLRKIVQRMAWDGRQSRLWKRLATVPCVVLDPFAGSGRALLVANRLGCHAIGIDLNEKYADIYRQLAAQPAK